MTLFNKKKKEITETEHSAGVRNYNDKQYRKDRHEYLLSETDLTPDTIDSWVIDEILVNDNQKMYLPYPLWDDEPVLSRETFSSYNAARQHVIDLNGTILEDQ